MPLDPLGRRKTWLRKFACAVRGLRVGVHGHTSFYVHVPAAVLTLLAAWRWQVSREEWCLLLLCITLVFAAELFNSALESLAQAVDRQPNPLLADALDIASGAVLAVAIGAVVVGVVIFLPHLWS